MTPKPLKRLYAVCDPTGHIDHTTISVLDEDAVGLWMKTEQTLIPIFRGKPAQSWEVYEAEGYSVVRVDVVPEYSEPTGPSVTVGLPDHPLPQS